MTEIEFDSKNHKYYIDKIEFPSVTTILNVLNKPALVHWASNITADYILKNIDKIKNDDFNQREIVSLAKKEHRLVKEAAASVGTRTHRLVEDYLIANKYKGNPHKNKLMLSNISKDLEKPFYAFLDWIEDKNFVLLDVEKIIYSMKYKYAGTLDIRCLLNDKKYIIDLKTSSRIYDEMLLQLCGYKNAYEEINGDKEHRIGILRLDKLTGEPEWREYTNKDYRKHIKAFKHLVSYYNIIREK